MKISIEKIIVFLRAIKLSIEPMTDGNDALLHIPIKLLPLFGHKVWLKDLKDSGKLELLITIITFDFYYIFGIDT